MDDENNEKKSLNRKLPSFNKVWFMFFIIPILLIHEEL